MPTSPFHNKQREFMSLEIFDIVIPLYRIRWNTRAVLEGLTGELHTKLHNLAKERKSLLEKAFKKIV